jgi:hypothetical protein
MAIGASKTEGPVFETQIETQITAQPGGTSSGNEKVSTPKDFIVLRIVQLIIAVIAIGLTSYLMVIAIGLNSYLIGKDHGVSFSVTRFPHYLHGLD